MPFMYVRENLMMPKDIYDLVFRLDPDNDQTLICSFIEVFEYRCKSLDEWRDDELHSFTKICEYFGISMNQIDTSDGFFHEEYYYEQLTNLIIPSFRAPVIQSCYEE